MSEKCNKTPEGNIERCAAAQYAITNNFVTLQHMRDMQTGQKRQQIALVKKKEMAPFLFCPWCAQDIDTYRYEEQTE